MKLHRFCSKREYDAYMSGELMLNTTNHYHLGAGGSISRGFCFFRGTNIAEWARRLNGVVDFDVLITIDIAPEDVTESVGVYADWSKDDGKSIPPKALFPEYCTSAYGMKNSRLISADFSYRDNHKYVSRSEIIAMYPYWALDRAYRLCFNAPHEK